jgi:hypothetical protein
MAQVQITDVVVPAEFTAYQVENSMLSTALFQSGVLLPNGEMQAQLQAGAESFTVPFWSDIPDVEADITTDNSAVLSTPQKITAAAQVVRRSFLHASWSEMSLASELSGSEALMRVQSRVGAYWDRQFEKRLIASLLGVLYSNVANNSGDMVNDIHALTGIVTLPGTRVIVVVLVIRLLLGRRGGPEALGRTLRLRSCYGNFNARRRRHCSDSPVVRPGRRHHGCHPIAGRRRTSCVKKFTSWSR